MREFKHGDPMDKATTLGPQADDIQSKAVRDFLAVGASDGKAVVGGHGVGSTNFIEPTVFVDVGEDSKINKQEVFGPVYVCELVSVRLKPDSTLAASWSTSSRPKPRRSVSPTTQSTWSAPGADGQLLTLRAL